MSYEIPREDMIGAVQRMFERESGSGYGMFEVLDRETDGGKGNVDLIYAYGGENPDIHVVRTEDSYDSCLFDVNSGIHVLQNVEANERWIALPLPEFRDGEDQYNEVMKQECRERGVGIISVQKKGRGYSAKVLLESSKEEGNFLGDYGQDVVEKWQDHVAGEEVVEDYRVVDYYQG